MASFQLATIMVMSLITASSAYDFYVGGRDGWGLNPRENYNNWAGRLRFQINDRLVFKYKSGEDSVLLVKKEDFDSCNVNSPIQKLEGGDSAFQLDRSGPFYFISGASDRCAKGEKLLVVVLADRNKKPLPPPPSSSPSPPSPSPAPPASSPTTSPSPAPAPGSVVAPPPSTSPAPAPGSVVTPPPSTSPASAHAPGSVVGPPPTSPAPPPALAPPGNSSSSSSSVTAAGVTIGTVALVMAHAFLG